MCQGASEQVRPSSIHRLKLNRRSLLIQAARAGVGAAALALVGCAATEVAFDERQRQTDSQDRRQPEGRRQGDRGQSHSREEVVERVERTATQEHDSTSTSRFDPLELRQQHHWRELQSIAVRHGPVRPGGEISIDAPGPREWSPFTEVVEAVDDVGLGGPGHFLPLLYSQLLTTDAAENTSPHRTTVTGDLATTWEWPDEVTLLFRIQDGVVWPDREPTYGRPLVASDIAITYEAFRAPERAQSGSLEVVRRIEANDVDDTLTFHLSNPAVYLMNKMTSPWHVIVPRELVHEPSLIDWSNASRGTGPFTLFLSAPGREWRLKRNPSYFKHDSASGIQLPYLDAIRSFDYVNRRFHRGQSNAKSWQREVWRTGKLHSVRLPDGMTEALQALEFNSEAMLQVTPPRPSGGLHFLYRTVQNGPYADARVRRALSMALDRGAFSREMFDGFAAYDCRQNWTFFRSAAGADDLREWPWEPTDLGPMATQDAQTAAALLRSAGYSEEAPLVLNLDVPPALSPASTELPVYEQTMATALAQQQWEHSLGGLVDVRPIEQHWKPTVERPGWTRFDRFPDDAADVVFGPTNRIFDVDPDDLAHGELHSKGKSNWSGIAAADLDGWAEAQREAVDPLERADLLEKIRAKSLEEAYRIFLVNPYKVSARTPNVFNLYNTYYADSLELAPKQLERTWIGA